MKRPLFPGAAVRIAAGCVASWAAAAAVAQDPPGAEILARPGLHKALTEPPCSYVSTQHLKGFVGLDDRVVAWVRGPHNGGAIPLRHFLAAPRVINDTYGLFFYDPDGGYVTAYRKDYGYEFHGWRRGVMVVRGSDGGLWSALSGRAISGPQKDKRLARVPNVLTTWGHWLLLHPESTAYDLFDGTRYATAELPAELSAGARQTMGAVDPRLEPLARVLGVEAGGTSEAFPLDGAPERACFTSEVGGVPVAVFWYGPTGSAVAFRSSLKWRLSLSEENAVKNRAAPGHGVVRPRRLSFYADSVAPPTAPFMDRETGSRWTLAGRAVDGPLRGEELTWVESVACRWYAWAAEYPETAVHGSRKSP